MSFGVFSRWTPVNVDGQRGNEEETKGPTSERSGLLGKSLGLHQQRATGAFEPAVYQRPPRPDVSVGGLEVEDRIRLRHIGVGFV